MPDEDGRGEVVTEIRDPTIARFAQSARAYIERQEAGEATPKRDGAGVGKAVPGVDAQSVPQARQEATATRGEPQGIEAVESLFMQQVASRVGLDPEDVKAMGPAATKVLQKLRAAEDKYSARLGAIGAKALGLPASSEAGRDGTTAAAAGEQQAAPSPQYPPELAEALGKIDRALGLDLQPEALGEEAAEALGTIKDAVGGMRQALEPFLRVQMQRAAEEFMGRFDRVFEELGPDFEHVFGPGRFTDLDPASPALSARKALAQTAISIARGAQEMGTPVDDRSAVEAALSLLYPKLKDQATRNRIVDEAQAAKGRFLQRTAGRPEPQQPRNDREEFGVRYQQAIQNLAGAIPRWGA